MSRVISFLSAKGGVGKTTIIYNLAKMMRELDYRVCVFDAYFSMNSCSLLFEKEKTIDFKEYLVGRVGTDFVLNKVNENLYFVKTNSNSFEYLKHQGLIKFFIEEAANRFDYIFIDVNCFNEQSLMTMLNSSSEAVVVADDDNNSLRNCAKLISKVKLCSHVYDIKIILNKMRVIHLLKNKTLSETEISSLLKTNIIFSIPKFLKYNNKFKRNVIDFEKKYSTNLCYSLITNKWQDNINKKQYKGLIGFIRRLRYIKYE